MLSNLTNLADQMSRYSSAILLFFFLISSNYLGGLYSCGIKRLLEKRWVVHILAIVTMFVSVINANAVPTDSTVKSFLVSVGLYGVFVAMTKGKLAFNLVVIGLLVAVYLLTQAINNSDLTQEEQAQRVEMMTKLRTVLLVGMVGTCVIGTGRYFQSKKSKFGSGFNFAKFWIGTDDCGGN